MKTTDDVRHTAIARIAGTLDRLASLVERMADTHPQRHEAREIAIEARKMARADKTADLTAE